MELEEWLRIYQAVTTAAAGKAREYWAIVVGFLVADCLLVFPLAFVFFSYTAGAGRYFVTVLAGIGALISILWTFAQSRAAHELIYFETLLRGIEGQFAGAELYRGLARLRAGEEIVTVAGAWRGKEWQTDTARFKRGARAPIHLFLTLLALICGGAWIALAVFAWIS